MRILKIKLENFQGVKHLGVEPQGANCSIYGDYYYGLDGVRT